MNKIILGVFFLTIISCNSKEENQDREIIDNLKGMVNSLESRINALNSKIETLESDKVISFKRGFLTLDLMEKDKYYWDILTLNNTVSFAYHRKNESEMWQPIPDAYSSSSSGYIRISNYNTNNELIGEEYLVISFQFQ